MINLSSLSEDFPIEITEEEYNHLKHLKQFGWSQCNTQKEWLVKLHYLRTGFREQKIDKTTFFAKEKDLILNWWRRWC